jgi:hypothetical protein
MIFRYRSPFICIECGKLVGCPHVDNKRIHWKTDACRYAFYVHRIIIRIQEGESVYGESGSVLNALPVFDSQSVRISVLHAINREVVDPPVCPGSALCLGCQEKVWFQSVCNAEVKSGGDFPLVFIIALIIIMCCASHLVAYTRSAVMKDKLVIHRKECTDREF